VLIASGVLGFRVGYVGFPTWHVAVQTAQVLAGLVTYPPDNPFYIYHARLWTLLHQLGAFRIGGVLLGLAPGLHPSFGAWLWLLIALAGFSEGRSFWERARAGRPYFAVGR
jgi:hypothetical protein